MTKLKVTLGQRLTHPILFHGRQEWLYCNVCARKRDIKTVEEHEVAKIKHYEWKNDLDQRMRDYEDEAFKRHFLRYRNPLKEVIDTIYSEGKDESSKV